ncbi:hypothetical protein [Poriferisphaera sp. WC338]|uniref:hypothetical protein n=1 Tax=Poriferisphaera sp. WC338 TaxID=3425129 RepID=UPI003D814D99
MSDPTFNIEPLGDGDQASFDLHDSDNGEELELVLVKHGQRFVFRCKHGREADLISQLAEQVRNPDCELDWFDAAVISHQMGQKLKERLGNMMHRKTG